MKRLVQSLVLSATVAAATLVPVLEASAGERWREQRPRHPQQHHRFDATDHARRTHPVKPPPAGGERHARCIGQGRRRAGRIGLVVAENTAVHVVNLHDLFTKSRVLDDLFR